MLHHSFTHQYAGEQTISRLEAQTSIYRIDAPVIRHQVVRGIAVDVSCFTAAQQIKPPGRLIYCLLQFAMSLLDCTLDCNSNHYGGDVDFKI